MLLNAVLKKHNFVILVSFLCCTLTKMHTTYFSITDYSQLLVLVKYPFESNNNKYK